LKLRILCLIIIFLSFCSIASGNDKVKVKHINGSPITGEIDKIENNKIYITKIKNQSEETDSTKTLDLQNLEEIEFIDKKTDTTESFIRETEVFLTTGDVFFGRIIRATEDEEGFLMETQSFGKIPLKLDWIQRINNAENPDSRTVVDPDVIKKKADAIYFMPKESEESNSNSETDILVGSVNAITEKGVDFTDSFGYYEDYVFKWSEVMAVTFYHDEITDLEDDNIKHPKTFQVIASCTTGERFTGEIISFKEQTYTFKSPVLKAGEIEGLDVKLWKQHEKGLLISIQVSKLLKFTFRYGNFTYLSDIEPSKIEEFPFFGGKGAVNDYSKYWWRFKRDKSVTGRDLFLSDKKGRRNRLTKGLGVHSYSKITYKLDDDYVVFKADIGIEAGSGKQASVIFRVYCDDEKKYESPIVRPQTGFLKISVDIKNAKLLHLEVDFADNGDIQDRAIWGRAIIFKK